MNLPGLLSALALILAAWLASKAHTRCSGRWIKREDHAAKLRELGRIYERRYVVGIEQEWEG